MSNVGKKWPERFLPAAITAVIGLIGTLGCAIITLADEPEMRSGGLITALAVHRAGATITPSVPR